MALTEEQFKRIEHLFPTPRGNCKIDALTVLNAYLYILTEGCSWRGLPTRFGRWHTVYMRWNRWAKKGVWINVFQGLAGLGDDALGGGDRRFGQHDGEGAQARRRGSKKNGRQAIGRSRGGLTTKIHAVTASARNVLCLRLSPGNSHDCAGGPGAAQAAPAKGRILGDGQGLFGRQDASGRCGLRLRRGRAAEVEPQAAVEIRQGNLQETQRG